MTYVTTRKLTMTQIEEMGKWIKANTSCKVTIRECPYERFIQIFCAEHDGNKRIWQLKVEFSDDQDATHFLMAYG